MNRFFLLVKQGRLSFKSLITVKDLIKRACRRLDHRCLYTEVLGLRDIT